MSSPIILRAHVEDELPVLEMAPEDVLAGDPAVRSKVLLHDGSDMSQGYSGIFSAEPGTVRSPLAAHESFYIAEGRARVTGPDGVEATLKAGDVAVLSPGDWTWTFESTFRCVFVAAPARSGEGAQA